MFKIHNLNKFKIHNLKMCKNFTHKCWVGSCLTYISIAFGGIYICNTICICFCTFICNCIPFLAVFVSICLVVDVFVFVFVLWFKFFKHLHTKVKLQGFWKFKILHLNLVMIFLMIIKNLDLVMTRQMAHLKYHLWHRAGACFFCPPSRGGNSQSPKKFKSCGNLCLLLNLLLQASKAKAAKASHLFLWSWHLQCVTMTMVIMMMTMIMMTMMVSVNMIRL